MQAVFCQKWRVKITKNWVTRSTPWNAKNDGFLEHPLALSTSGILNFFFKKNLEKWTIFTPDDFGQNGSNFTRRIFRKITDFLKNVSGFPEIDHFLKNWSFFKNSSFFKKPRVFRKRLGCFSSKMMDKNDPKWYDKLPPMKRRKRCFSSTPAGALDSLNFCLFLDQKSRKSGLFTLTIFVKHYKILHDRFSGKSPIF